VTSWKDWMSLIEDVKHEWPLPSIPLPSITLPLATLPAFCPSAVLVKALCCRCRGNRRRRLCVAPKNDELIACRNNQQAPVNSITTSISHRSCTPKYTIPVSQYNDDFFSHHLSTTSLMYCTPSCCPLATSYYSSILVYWEFLRYMDANAP
jgi:hypothetical protein